MNAEQLRAAVEDGYLSLSPSDQAIVARRRALANAQRDRATMRAHRERKGLAASGRPFSTASAVAWSIEHSSRPDLLINALREAHRG